MIYQKIYRKTDARKLGDTFECETEMVFGTGDIGFNPGLYISDEGPKLASIIFYNQTPREIGFGNGDVPAGEMVNIEDFPVKMIFHKVESIDVLINALEEAKELMLKE